LSATLPEDGNAYMNSTFGFICNDISCPVAAFVRAMIAGQQALL
jgi:hypothetical protein